MKTSDTLRFIADALDKEDEGPLLSIHVYSAPRELFLAIARTCGRATKHGGDNSYWLRFGNVSVFTDRLNVCRRVEKGARLVKREKPVKYETTWVEEPIVEWICDEPLLTQGGKGRRGEHVRRSD